VGQTFSKFKIYRMNLFDIGCLGYFGVVGDGLFRGGGHATDIVNCDILIDCSAMN